MYMKKSKILLIVLPLIAAIGAGTYFYVRLTSNAYLNVIPIDAVGVARIDLKTSLEEAELTVADCVKMLESSQDVDAENLGLDLSRPAYAFASATGNIGFVAAMDDEDDFTSLCEGLHKQGRASVIARQRGMSWVVLEQQWLCAFDGTLALVLGPAVGAAQDQLRSEMARLLKQDKDESVQKSELFAQLRRKDGAVVAVIGPELLPAKARMFLYKFDINRSEDALLRMRLSADKNVLKLNTEIVALKDNVKDQIKELGKRLRPIKGTLIGHAHDKNTVWIGANFEGKSLLGMLRSTKQVRMALAAMNLVLDLDRIIETIDGDVALEMSRPTLFNMRSLLSLDLSNIYLTAHVANSDFFKEAGSWGNGLIAFNQQANSQYAVSMGSRRFYLGVDKGIFYTGDEPGLANGDNALLNQEKSHIKGSRLYAYLALPEIINKVSQQVPVPDMFRKFESLTMEMPEPDQLVFRLKAPEGTLIAKELLTNE